MRGRSQKPSQSQKGHFPDIMNVLNDTVEGHVLTRSGQDLTQAWAGQTHFNISGSARLGRAHISTCVKMCPKCVKTCRYTVCT